jgi:hypothetical protein
MTVDQGDAGLGLAGAGGHGEQQGAGALGDGGLAGQDRGLLVGAQGEAVVEGFGLERRGGPPRVLLEQGGQTRRAVPTVQGAAQVVRLA